MEKGRGSYATEKRLWIYAGLIAGLGLSLAILLWRAQPAPADTTAPAFPQQDLQAALHELSLSFLTYQSSRQPADLERLNLAETAALGVAGRTRVRGLDSGRVSRAVKSLSQAAHVAIRAENSESDTIFLFGAHLSQVNDLLDQRLTEARKPTSHPPTLVKARGESATLASQLALFTRFHQADSLTAFRRSEQTMLKLLDGYPSDRASAEWTARARTMLSQASNDARQVLEADKDRETAVREFLRGQADLSLLLSAPEPLSAASAVPMMRRWISPEATMGAAAIATAALLTVVLLMITFVRRELLAPLGSLAAIADAAATGDLSRQFRMRTWNEVGSVALAVNRLISVMARSENLIYHLATLIETSGEAIVSHTLDGTILSWNRGAQRLYGYSAEEIKGHSIAQLWPENQQESFERLLDAVKKGERIKPFEMTQRGKNGRPVHVLMRVASIFDSTRQVIGASICLQQVAKSPTTHAPRISSNT